MRLSGRAWVLIAVSVFCFCPIFYEGYRIPGGQVFCSSTECHIFVVEGKLGIVTTPALELIVEGLSTWGRSPSDSTASLTVIDITSKGISEHQFPGKSTLFSMVDSRFMTDWAEACGERGAICEWTGERFRAVDAEPSASFKAHHYDTQMFDEINGWTGESLFCPNG